MRLVQNHILLIVLVCLASCRTVSYFDSPNNLKNREGRLYLHNGKTIDGKLVIETENIFGGKVKLFAGDEKKPMQFSLSQVRGYAMDNNEYELKEIREGLSIGKRQYFMKRLTPEGSRMHLYEFSKKEIVNKTSSRHVLEYYVELPGEEENLVFSTNGSHFVPHFEQKVSRIVSDCPTLAKKIAEKQNGFFYAQVNLLREKRVDVLMRIIDEYNKCGK
ncbi:MAG: hypothetical protein EOO14_09005 [Chitinophagaceae bacterium]|nr:MAG: hypothetical protein EOO14_09005 [Chitinophagaceae bacterium]